MAQSQRRTSSRASGGRASDRAPARREGQGAELAGLGLLAAGVFFAVVIWFGWEGGIVGGKLAQVFEILVGQTAVLIPALLAATGLLLMARSDIVDLRPFRVGLVILGVSLVTVAAAGIFGIGPESPAPKTLDPSVVDDYGGLLGGLIAFVSRTLIGDTGTAILCVLGLMAGGLLVTGASIGVYLRSSARASARAAGHTARAAKRGAATFVRNNVRERIGPAVQDEREPDPGHDLVEPSSLNGLMNSAVAAEESVSRHLASNEGVLAGAESPSAIDEAATAPEASSEASSRVESSLEHDTEDDPMSHEGFALEPASGNYTLPSKRSLKVSDASAAATPGAQATLSRTLVETLASFGVEATVVGEVAGPRITRYELQLAPGTKISKVTQLRDDLAYALASTDIRILAPIPGKQAVGVEVPNYSKNLVTLGDVAIDLPANASPLSVWLGKDISGNPVWADLARMPHLLIAGTTGSGKSGCINAMLCSLLLRATPDELRMILIDPKRVELGPYESIPHLLTSVVSSPKRAAAALVNVVEEMEIRYQRMSVAKARNLVEFNRVLEKRGEEPLPYLLVVIDELADLMMISPQDVEDAIIRLAQKSRAVGIHLVLATQRPSVDVITGMIKANVPSRIAFAVSSQTDSRVILDGSGAESLLGSGDMLFKPLGTSRLQRIQGAYVTDEEISLVVEHCRRQRDQQLDESLLDAPEPPGPDTADEGLDPDDDPLLDKAIDVVVQTQSASVSMIQRRLRVGYTRAGRLVDMLERRGIISGYEGSKPRRVLLSAAQLAERGLLEGREHEVEHEEVSVGS
jgi:S-DNA-T family DNA segregation ATPase FtsK/SpoIIIE